MSKALSENMRSMLWAMLKHQRNPGNSVLMIENERTAQALVRRGLLTQSSAGYELNEKAARAALKAAS